ncbi:hypothetical protein V6N13_033106 [Hibiscus sabdariffa]
MRDGATTSMRRFKQSEWRAIKEGGSRDRFWKKKKGVTPPPIERLIVVCESPPQVSANTLRQVEGVIAGDNREVLDRCAIGWCKSPILNANLVEAMRSADIVGFQMMRISGDRVLLIFDDVGVRTRMLASDSMSKWFDRVVEWNEEDCAMGCRRVWISIFGVSIHAWSRETFERVMSHWGNVILMAKETLEPSSFERGRVLIETGVLDRIEERLELVVEGRKFSIRLSETDTFLRGPRCSCSRDTQDSSTDSERMENHSQDASAEQKDRVDVVRQFDKDKDVVEVGGADSKSGDEMGLNFILSLMRRALLRRFYFAMEVKKKCRQSAILKEAISTVEFGKLLGVKTIGQEKTIVQNIARIIAQSQ